jgi:hypothetical protein
MTSLHRQSTAKTFEESADSARSSTDKRPIPQQSQTFQRILNCLTYKMFVTEAHDKDSAEHCIGGHDFSVYLEIFSWFDPLGLCCRCVHWPRRRPNVADRSEFLKK